MMSINFVPPYNLNAPNGDTHSSAYLPQYSLYMQSDGVRIRGELARCVECSSLQTRSTHHRRNVGTKLPYKTALLLHKQFQSQLYDDNMDISYRKCICS